MPLRKRVTALSSVEMANFYKSNYDIIYSQALSMTNNAQLSDTIAQQAFLMYYVYDVTLEYAFKYVCDENREQGIRSAAEYDNLFTERLAANREDLAFQWSESNRSARSLEMLCKHYINNMSIGAIAQEYNMSPEKVRRIVTKAYLTAKRLLNM